MGGFKGVMIKVLFLDIDGVWNRCGHGPEHYGFNRGMINLTHRIVRETGCKVVLSSTWRKYPHLKERVKAEIKIHDCTPEDHQGLFNDSRGREIRLWLDAHPEVGRFVVVDDDSTAGNHGLEPYWVRTESFVGLTGTLAQEIINRLNA